MTKTKKILIIQADTNDADYVTEETEINDKTLELIRPVIKAIKNFKPYEATSKSGLEWTHGNNFPTGECLRKDLGEKSPEELYLETGLVSEKAFDTFQDMVPSAEYGIHTIKSIRVLEIVSDKELLK